MKMIRPMTSIAVVALAVLLPPPASADGPLFPNSDFTQGTFDNWTPEGEAFQSGPTTSPVDPGGDVTGSATKDLKVRWDTQPEVYRQAAFSGLLSAAS